MEILDRGFDFGRWGDFLSDHFIHDWKRPDQPFMIALTYLVGACRRFWSVDPVMNRQPHETIQ